MAATLDAFPSVNQTTPFTAAEVTDIRRFAGYPAFGAFGYLFGGNAMANLDWQCSQMSDQEQAIVRTVYLANLTGLEAAILTSGANMGTDIAAVWTRNRTEAGDRRDLFNSVRLALCEFIGVAPGPGLSAGGGVVRC